MIREDNFLLNQTITYTYDSDGDLLTKAIYPYKISTLGTATNTYTYKYKNASIPDQLTSFNGSALSYDSNGNLTAYNGWTYTWNGANLSGASNSSYSIYVRGRMEVAIMSIQPTTKKA